MHNLTEGQKTVLRWLVSMFAEGPESNEILINWTNEGPIIFGFKRKVTPPIELSRGNLEVLGADGYLLLSPLNHGVRCTLRGRAEQAVAANFADVDGQPHTGRLKRFLSNQFSEEELRSLCLDFGVDHENIGGTTRDAFARELTLHAHRRGISWDLVHAAFKMN